MSETVIEFKAVDKWFGKLHVLRAVDLAVSVGEVVVVCGPSGSGKSTLIRCVNGLEAIQGGELVVLGESITRPGVRMPALRTRVGMVFQSFNLFPHMTVLQNITLAPVRVKGLSAAEAEKTARALLERVRIPDKAAAYPATRRPSPAASSSAWRSRGRWRCSRGSCSSTSRRPRSTRR